VEENTADHQLDDAQLAVGDLERIITVYSRMLVSMYHARCEYPQPAAMKGRPASADQHHQPSRA
jgi:membrane-associated HD superfamily phosphohydrolase